MDERDYEAEAKEDNWVPQDEWKGDPDKWVDAKTFVERGEKILPIVKSKLDKVEAELAEMRKTNQEFGKHHKQQMEREKAKRQQLLQELEEARAQAISDGDGKEAVKVEKQIREIEREEVPQDISQNQQVMAQWQSQNEWYGQNRKLTAMADGLCESVAAEGYTGKAYFDELTRRVKEMAPEEFENPNRGKANGVESGKKAPPSKKRSYDNLPSEAKAACDRFVKAGIFKSADDYVKNYEWE